jgi:hypothetical protein
MPRDNTLEHGRCRHFLRYADIARKDETKCGKGGKYFYPNPQKEHEYKRLNQTNNLTSY